MQYQLPDIFPSNSINENHAICFCVNGKSFYVLATDKLVDYHFTGDTQCLPLYRYTEEGEQVSNITDWAIRRINDHYRAEWGEDYPRIADENGITTDDIFAYTYAVLHNPEYRDKYTVDLLREFPRLPLYQDFNTWKRMGQELLELHLGFESAKPWPLKRLEQPRPARLRHRAGRRVAPIPHVGPQGLEAPSSWTSKTTLTGVPAEAWQYRLGSRSALEWVLDQYKEKKPRDPTIRERFNTYRFADHKERVIDLLQRVCTVSVRTVEIVAGMADL